MAESTPDDRRAALVERIAATVTWHLQPIAGDEMDRLRIDDPKERAAYDAAGAFREGAAAVQAIRRRKVAEAVLSMLKSGETGVHLVHGGDLQGSVGVVIGQLREARAEIDELRREVDCHLAAYGRDQAEIARLRDAYATTSHVVEQALGKALGYPVMGPEVCGPEGNPGGDVCVGDHVPESLAAEAAAKIVELATEIVRLRREMEQLRAGRFDPGPVVRETDLLGWIVSCQGCSAVTLQVPDRDAGLRRAELHQHVYPDADGFVSHQGAWPT
jgi:hypothetical protein